MNLQPRKRLSARLSKFLIVFVLISLLPSKNFEREKRRVERRARWKIGSLYIRPFLELRNLGYDYNVYTAGGNVGDWFISGGGGLDASLLRPSFLLKMSIAPNFLAFLHHPSENFASTDIKGELASRIWKLHLFTDYAKFKRKQRPPYEMAPRVIIGYEGFSFSAELSPGFPLSMGVIFKRENFSYKRPETNFLFFSPDRVEYNYIFFIKRRIFTATHLLLELGLRRANFKMDPERRDAIHRWFSLGAELPDVGVIQGSFAVGYKEISPLKSGDFHFKGLYGMGNILADLNIAFFSLLYTLDWNYSPYFGEIVRVELVRAGAGVRLAGRRIKIRARRGWGKLTFPFMERIDKIKSYEGDFLLRIRPGTYVGLAYSRMRSSSTVAGWTRKLETIGGIIEYGF